MTGAIVTDVAGTTRDTVEEKAEVGGVLLRLIDTAGLRETEDTVERLGVERAVAAARSAGLVLAVVDGSREMTGEDLAVLERAGGMGVPWILVWSKADLPGAGNVPCLRFTGGTAAPAAVVEVSSVTGQGLSDLAAAVADLFPAGEVPAGQILTNARQAQAVERAADALARARAALDLSPDAALTDVEEAQNALGELTGPHRPGGHGLPDLRAVLRGKIDGNRTWKRAWKSALPPPRKRMGTGRFFIGRRCIGPESRRPPPAAGPGGSAPAPGPARRGPAPCGTRPRRASPRPCSPRRGTGGPA